MQATITTANGFWTVAAGSNSATVDSASSAIAVAKAFGATSIACPSGVRAELKAAAVDASPVKHYIIPAPPADSGIEWHPHTIGCPRGVVGCTDDGACTCGVC